MRSLVSGALLASLLAAGVAVAQTKPPATTAPDPAADSKFKAADKNSSGTLEGAEVDAYKSKMTQIDTNKDGKVSREEFAAASKAGHIR